MYDDVSHAPHTGMTSTAVMTACVRLSVSVSVSVSVSEVLRRPCRRSAPPWLTFSKVLYVYIHMCTCEYVCVCLHVVY